MQIGPIIFSIILLLITFYVIMHMYYQNAGNNDVLTSMTPLNTNKIVYNSDVTQQNLLSSSGSTVMGFFNLQNGDRTSKYVGNFTPLIQIANNWYLEISPVKSSNSSSAQLRIVTNEGGTLKEEIVELPDIPQQKWMFIAILRDGRRFDVIYDDKIVASQRLEYYPVVISSPLSIGNKGLNGSAIHIIVNNTRLTPTAIERVRLSHVDTNNTVLEANVIDMSFPGFNLFAQCPPGLPCNPITKPPNNNLLQWKSPYA